MTDRGTAAPLLVRTWAPAAAGVLAALAGLATAQVGAALLGAGGSPVLALADQVIAHSPAAVRDRAIDLLGTADKPVLVVAVLVVTLGLAALLGTAGRRRPGVVWPGAVLLAGLGSAAVLGRPGARPVEALPTLVGALVAGAALDALARRLPGPTAAAATAATAAADSTEADSTEADPTTADPTTAELADPGWPDRRGFLRAAAGTGLVTVVAGFGGRFLDRRRAAAAASRAAITIPAPAAPAPPVPAGAELGVPGVAPLRTPAADFYRIDTALVVPALRAEDWSLRVHGMVDRELRLSYADLLARPLIERDVTLSCVSNEVGGDLISSGRWIGAPLGPLLAEARVRPGADQLVGRSTDGWTAGTPVATVLDGRDAMLAVAYNGEPLPIEHGFPVRMLVPGLYGYVSATKWLIDLELTTFDAYDAFWIRRGWAARAPVKTASRIDTPRDGSSKRAGPVVVAGVAWAQRRGIGRVEVRVDEGPWAAAELAPAIGPDTWRQWRWRWDATPGRHVLDVRATDGTGAVQTGASRPPVPDGATGWHRVEVEVG
ncbi:MAG TPA: molybdopterin-dependent oxidoreductase [Mycobacteriales bacterium]|nr:molybdopterin-dependent oxidoreductase [Mycobacteriales bacterium]